MAKATIPSNRTIKLADYRPHPRNPNQHSQQQIERIAASLAAFGQVRSIVVWRGYFLAGHGVAAAARSLGWLELRADVLADEYPEHLALAYLAADNELGRQSDPDLAQLAAILDESAAADPALLLAIGYSDAEYDRLLAEMEVTALRDAAPAEGGRLAGIDRAKQIKAVLYAADVRDFERAILATGERNRAAALLLICREYLGAHGESQTAGQFDAELESVFTA